jgi:hypothetical protein
MKIGEGLTTFLSQPYKGEKMDLLGWFLFVGFVVVAAFVWQTVLAEIKGD